MRPDIWVVSLTVWDGEVVANSAATLAEVAGNVTYFALRQRFATDERLVTLRLPHGTTRDQVFEAFSLLTADERRRFYKLPQRPMGGGS